MENLLLPSKVEFQEAGKNSGVVTITPCYHGYGTTLGNALRRVLLSSLPGAAVEAFKIKGAQHEFTTVDGVKEDVVELMLNFKQLVVRSFSDEKVVLTLSKKGPGPVTAGDIESNSNVEVVNKDMVLANLTNSKAFEAEIVVGRGRGYKPVEEKDRQNYDLGSVVVDSVYTPIKDVGYHVEYTRVGDITNYEKLTVNIETNGTITPKDAMQQATQILMDHFQIILSGTNNVPVETEIAKEPEAPVEEKVEEKKEEAAEEAVEKKEEKKVVKTKKKKS